jgi:hypothetical protein
MVKHYQRTKYHEELPIGIARRTIILGALSPVILKDICPIIADYARMTANDKIDTLFPGPVGVIKIASHDHPLYGHNRNVRWESGINSARKEFRLSLRGEDPSNAFDIRRLVYAHDSAWEYTDQLCEIPELETYFYRCQRTFSVFFDALNHRLAQIV